MPPNSGSVFFPAMQLFSLRVLLILIASVPLRAATPDPAWRVPERGGVSVVSDSATEWRIVSTITDEYAVESAQSVPARPGDCFTINVRVRVGLDTRASPELVCYGADGRELRVGVQADDQHEGARGV